MRRPYGNKVMPMTEPIKIVFLRHGESTWQKENRFAGWTDIDLTEQGRAEARRAGRLMGAAGLSFDVVFTSYLKRGIRTTWLALEGMDLMWIPEVKTWRLNERFYGALQGLNRSETAAKYGEEQVRKWRRGYFELPPQITKDDPRFPGRDPRYKEVPMHELPTGESLELAVKRVMPCWEQLILPELRRGKRVLVSAHINSIRALVKNLDALTPEQVEKLEIPLGFPLVYELGENYKPLTHYYLGDPKEIEAYINRTLNQGKAAPQKQ